MPDRVGSRLLGWLKADSMATFRRNASPPPTGALARAVGDSSVIRTWPTICSPLQPVRSGRASPPRAVIHELGVLPMAENNPSSSGGGDPMTSSTFSTDDLVTSPPSTAPPSINDIYSKGSAEPTGTSAGEESKDQPWAEQRPDGGEWDRRRTPGLGRTLLREELRGPVDLRRPRVPRLDRPRREDDSL